MTLNNIVGTNEGAEEIFKRILQDPRISDLMVFNQVGLCVRSTKESGVSSQYGAHVDNLRRHLDHNLRDADCLGGTVTLVRVNTDKHELLIAPDTIAATSSKLRKKDRHKIENSKYHSVDIESLPIESLYDCSDAKLFNTRTRPVFQHYNILKDLFKNPDNVGFKGVAKIHFNSQEGDLAELNQFDPIPVFHGNLLKPNECRVPPAVELCNFNKKCLDNKNEQETDSAIDPKINLKYYSISMVNIDGFLSENFPNLLHCANIPGSSKEKLDEEQGKTLFNYFQPLPFRGTGFHRFGIIIYEHEKSIDYSDFLPNYAEKDLVCRKFNHSEFYEKCDHDKSVRAVLHNYFDLPEPHYKYKWPAHYVPKQTKKLPHYDPEYITESFNLYLERYEDKKHLAERTFLELFKDYSPFKDQTNPPSQFIIPNSKKIFIPSWKVDEMIAKYSRSQRFIPDLEQETDIDDSSENL